MPVVPAVAVLLCLLLVGNLPLITWARFLGPMAAGLLIHLCWGRRHSKVATGELAAGATPGTAEDHAMAEGRRASRGGRSGR